MKKLTRGRVVPIISARVSWLIFARIGSGFSFLAKVRQQQEQPGKPFLARIEQLIDEVCLDADGPGQKMGNEHPGERWLLMNYADNRRFFQAHDDGVGHRRDRRYAPRLPGKTSFPEEIVRSKHCDDGFLALLRNDGDLHLASLDIEDRIRGSPCEKTISSLQYSPMLRPSPTLARKNFGSNDGRRLIAMADLLYREFSAGKDRRALLPARGLKSDIHRMTALVRVKLQLFTDFGNAPRDVVIVGVRANDPLEQEMIDKFGIKIVPAADVKGDCRQLCVAMERLTAPSI